MRTQSVDPPSAGSEKEPVLGVIKVQQQVFLRTLEPASGHLLSVEQLRTPVVPTLMAVKCMAAHLSFIEDYWRAWLLREVQKPEAWTSIDWKANNDADWRIRTPIEEVLTGLHSALRKARNVLEVANWDDVSKRDNSDGDL